MQRGAGDALIGKRSRADEDQIADEEKYGDESANQSDHAQSEHDGSENDDVAERVHNYGTVAKQEPARKLLP